MRRPDPATLDILKTLVGFPTVSRDSNLELIEWVRDYLAEHGIERVLTRGEDARKANLFATIGNGSGGIILSGHTDVVPVDGQAWSTDPFELTERDGKLYGRGTCDMKGFIAVALAKVSVLKAAAGEEPIHLAFSFDEEIGCKGVGHMLADLAARGLSPRGCIVGEPTSMNTVVGHKAGAVYSCTVSGLEVHSSLAPQGVNAVEYASRLVNRIAEIAERMAQEERRHDGYEVPYSTMQTGVIGGGHAANIVPAACTFRFDIRTLPWTDPEALITEVRDFAETALLPRMHTIAPNAAIEIVRIGHVPGFAIDDDAPLTRYVQRLNRSNAAPRHVTFGSEAGLFQARAIPAVICGPGSISQAHKPDEFISLEQLALCEDFMDRLAATAFE